MIYKISALRLFRKYVIVILGNELRIKGPIMRTTFARGHVLKVLNRLFEHRDTLPSNFHRQPSLMMYNFRKAPCIEGVESTF